MRVRIGQRRDSNPEAGWEKPSGGGGWGGLGWVLAGVLVLAIVGTVVVLQKGVGKDGDASVQVADGMGEGIEAAEKVARAFLAEPGPAKRLQWVRNADEVKTRLAEYSDEARGEVGEITRCLAVGWIRGERDAEEEWGK